MMENKGVLTAIFIGVFVAAFGMATAVINHIDGNRGNVYDVPGICVYVNGEVENPGVYEFPVTARVKDAIEKAGGVTENGSAENLKLAAFLEDGETITVPGISDVSPVQENAEKNHGNAININTAGIEELKTLSGIGDATAKRIVEYREANGNFGTTEDLMNVSGIGIKKFEAIKDSVCVR